MPDVVDQPEVVDAPERSRLEIVQDDGVAVIEYRRRGDRLVIVHTGVPAHFEGRGYGSALVRGALQKARDEQLVVVPRCPYARSWIEGHPDDAAGVVVEQA